MDAPYDKTQLARQISRNLANCRSELRFRYAIAIGLVAIGIAGIVATFFFFSDVLDSDMKLIGQIASTLTASLTAIPLKDIFDVKHNIVNLEEFEIQVASGLAIDYGLIAKYLDVRRK